MSDIERGRDGTGLIVEEATPKLKRPPLYQVVLINDDYTPMEFVVDILQRFFSMDRTKATRVMLEVHTKGKGVCGVFTYEIAETKVAQVTTYARDHQHPLMCTLEEACYFLESRTFLEGRAFLESRTFKCIEGRTFGRLRKCCPTSWNTVSTTRFTRRAKRAMSI